MIHFKRTGFLFLAITSIFWACNKTSSDSDDPHNHSLLTKALSQIKIEISGRWQIKRSGYIICPFLGPCISIDSIYRNNEGDLFTFLSNDTIKLTGSTGTLIQFYEKATVAKIRLGTPVDSAYVFKIATGSHQYLMKEIKNDSLVVSDRGVDYWLTKKP